MAKKKPKTAASDHIVDVNDTITLLDGTTVPAAKLAHIAPYLRVFAVRADSLLPDPRNTRLHGDRDLKETAASLKSFGLRELLKFDPSTRVIKIGNGRWTCATDPAYGLNWEYVCAVPEDLSADQLKHFAIVHNRTGELSEWDMDELEKQLQDLADLDIEPIAFDDETLKALNTGDFETAHAFAPYEEPAPKEKKAKKGGKLMLVAKFASEKQQREWLDKLLAAGIECEARRM